MAGKTTSKKDLALMAMSYGYVYVAKVAVGADPNQLVKAFVEAESYDGRRLSLPTRTVLPTVLIWVAHY